MAIDEAARLHLYEQARTALGPAAADTLMSNLPRDPDRFATKDDVARLGTELRGEMAELRGEIAELRGEMHELRGEMQLGLANTVRTLMFGLVASNATMVGLVLAAVSLG